MDRLDIKHKQRIGLFGGTFNPIHYGHLRGAEEVREMFNLDRIIFIPSGIPPLKGSEVIEGFHRYEMVRLATTGNPCFEVSDYEIKLREPCYTVNTLDYFLRIYREHTLLFIIGVDAFLEIHKWYKPDELLRKIDFIVMARPNFDLESTNLIEKDCSAGFFRIRNSDKRLYYANITPIPLSSTLLRQALRDRRSIRYLTPDSVIDYISQHNLYKE